MMTRRENFAATLAHRTPDRMIVDFGGNPLSCMEGRSQEFLLSYLGYTPEKRDDAPALFGVAGRIDERILTAFDTDTRAVGKIFKPRGSTYRRISSTEYIDEWGMRRVFDGRYWNIVTTPLKGAAAEDLDHYDWPDPASIDSAEIDACRERAKYLFEETDYVVCAEHPVYGVFELGCWMCGFEDFMIKMALDPDFITAFFDRILAYQKAVLSRYYGAVGPYIHYTSSGDDFATQRSLFVSRSMWREMVAPYYKERIAFTKKFTKASYLHHSCGAVSPLVPDLIDCGVEILNPIQPRAEGMAPGRLKAAYGDRVVFHGGLDTQDVLPHGTSADVDREVQKTVEALNVNGGYIFAAAHNIQEDVPPENVAQMLLSAKKYGERRE